jgi:hypothetical protein
MADSPPAATARPPRPALASTAAAKLERKKPRFVSSIPCKVMSLIKRSEMKLSGAAINLPADVFIAFAAFDFSLKRQSPEFIFIFFDCLSLTVFRIPVALSAKIVAREISVFVARNQKQKPR